MQLAVSRMMRMAPLLLACSVPARSAEWPEWKLDDDALVQEARKGEEHAFLVMRVRGNPAHREVLRDIAENYSGSVAHTIRTWAKINLIWWGEDKYLHEFGLGISSTNVWYKHACLDALEKTKNRAAVRYLFNAFDDNEYWNEGDVEFEAPSHRAVGMLSRLVPNSGITWRHGGYKDHYAGEKRFWKKWWEKNRRIYENLSVKDGQLGIEWYKVKEGKLPAQE